MKSEAVQLLQQTGYAYTHRKPGAQPALGSGNQAGEEEFQSTSTEQTDLPDGQIGHAPQKKLPATTATATSAQWPAPLVEFFDPENAENNGGGITANRQSLTMAASGNGQTGLYNGYAAGNRMLSYPRQQPGSLINLLA
jgi:hypothetical protein